MGSRFVRALDWLFHTFDTQQRPYDSRVSLHVLDWKCCDDRLHFYFWKPNNKNKNIHVYTYNIYCRTVLVLSKLKKNKRNATFESILRYLRTLHIVWSLVRRRVTRCLTRFQTMYNVLKFSKKWWNNVKKSIYRNHNTTAHFVNLIRTSTVSCWIRTVYSIFGFFFRKSRKALYMYIEKWKLNNTTFYSADYFTGGYLMQHESIAERV